MRLVRFYQPQKGSRVGVEINELIYDVSQYCPNITDWLKNSVGRVEDAIGDLKEFSQNAPSFSIKDISAGIDAAKAYALPIVEEQDVWAAGVTYERSREARQEESTDGGDVYARVYRAERPELFFKARGRDVVGPFADVGIRFDALWSVPEPELALVLNPALELVGFTVGNDMSSRDIEGENPLYLPQAKVYRASCALGEGMLLSTERSWPEVSIQIRIIRNHEIAFAGETHTSRIRRSIDELVAYLGRCQSFPEGVILMTGTGVVPPAEFTLVADDRVEIEIEKVGRLVNSVKVIGQ